MECNEWVCTFGWGQTNAGCCVRITGTYSEARQKMFDIYGDKWAFQYPAEEWDSWKQDPNRAWYMEKEIELPSEVKSKDDK